MSGVKAEHTEGGESFKDKIDALDATSNSMYITVRTTNKSVLEKRAMGVSISLKQRYFHCYTVTTLAFYISCRN